jgi:hypothetical protein
LFSNLLFLFCLSFRFCIRSINYISSSPIQTKPAPWMARAYNQVGRAREARLQNIGLTCKRELARNLQSSYLADCVTNAFDRSKPLLGQPGFCKPIMSCAFAIATFRAPSAFTESYS